MLCGSDLGAADVRDERAPRGGGDPYLGEADVLAVAGTDHTRKVRVHDLPLDTDAASDQDRIDWRSDCNSIELTPIETPKEVLQSLRRYAAVMDLANFAADFIVQPSGRWLFLEAAPSGQWAWTNSPDLPVAKAIATVLEEWCEL